MALTKMTFRAGDLGEAIEIATDRVPDVIKSGAAIETRSVVCLQVEIECGEPMDLLNRGGIDRKIYWADRLGEYEAAGLLEADVVDESRYENVPDALSHIRGIVERADDDVRYFGGMRFDAGRAADREWKAFGRYLFILPRFLLVRDGATRYYNCNLLLPDDVEKSAAITKQLQSLNSIVEERSPDLSPPASRDDSPDENGWRHGVEAIVASAKAGQFDKLVLARRTGLTYDGEIPIREVLRRLKDSASGSYLFMFGLNERTAFVGATPERLYWRSGREIRCDAIAGTRPRGTSPDEDDNFAVELKRSEKDLKEHRLVVQSVKESLAGLTEEDVLPDGEPERVLKLARVQHLHTPLKALLRRDIPDDLLLAKLHPTAAVGGYPRQAVFEAIRKREAFDRGWYAGPVGWIGKDRAEFAVAIRSALADHKRLNLYAGAGILEGSEAGQEWREIENKIESFMRALNL